MLSGQSLFQSANAVGGGLDLKALGRQVFADQAAQLNVVIDNQICGPQASLYFYSSMHSAVKNCQSAGVYPLQNFTPLDRLFTAHRGREGF